MIFKKTSERDKPLFKRGDSIVKKIFKLKA